MLKKIITLSIVTAVVLIGVENVIAQERTDVPEQRPRRRQGQEGRPGQRDRAPQLRRQQEDREAPAKGAETDRKIEAMRKKRQQALEQKGTLQDRVGRRSQRSRPGRNKPMQKMFGGRGRGFQGRGMGGWNRGYQCGGLCPCCQRGMCPWYQGFSGRGMMGRGGQGFQGRGMGGWSPGFQGFQGRGMGGWSPGFQGRGMGRWGQGFRGRGMMGGQRPGMSAVPNVRPFPQNPPQEDVLRPAPPMQRRSMMGRGGRGFQGRGMGRWGQGFQPQGMSRPETDMPPKPDVRPLPQKSPEEDTLRPAPPMQRRGMGRRGGGGPFSGPGGPGPGPDNN